MVEKLVIDCGEVGIPRSIVSASWVGACSSSWASRGNVAAECRRGLGESFRRLELGWRGQVKFSARGESGVCRPSDERDR